MLCTIVLLISDPVGAKNIEVTNKASILALSGLQDFTDCTKAVGPCIIEDIEYVYVVFCSCLWPAS